ncbi:MAG: hypothetical protein HGA67_00365 [Candidatus Yonathbacteria bacterium]|nr:hypothetical protein [Candidatus Yonathbacteria bacterium]
MSPLWLAGSMSLSGLVSVFGYMIASKELKNTYWELNSYFFKTTQKIFLWFVLLSVGTLIEFIALFPKSLAGTPELYAVGVFLPIGIIIFIKTGRSLVPKHGHTATWMTLSLWMFMFGAFNLTMSGLVPYRKWTLVPICFIMSASIIFFWGKYPRNMAA